MNETASVGGENTDDGARAALFLFAHQDDEFAAAPQILDFVRRGVVCRFIYLTNGDGRRCDPDMRNEESAAALVSLGIARSNIDFLGTREGVRDGTLFRHLDRVLDLIVERGVEPFASVHSLAWEGGHPDHDAAHLIAAAVARRFSMTAWFFPFYNGYGRGGLLRVMKPVPHPKVEPQSLSLSDGVRTVLLTRHYRSQWKLWMRLLPEASFRLIGVRRTFRIPMDVEAVRERPHSGPLLYERTLNVPWQEVAKISVPFVSRRIDSGNGDQQR